MKVLILGADGYLGWSLAQYLTTRGHEVAGVDNYLRREWVKEEGAKSATPIKRMDVRLESFGKKYDTNLQFFQGDAGDYEFMSTVFKKIMPHAIVHLGEMPSAPFSMIDFEHAWLTHANNLKGTIAVLYLMRELCPDAHLVKLGTMGEYGTPNTDIPEGFFGKADEYRGVSLEGVLFPRHSSSWYHMTKVHDTNNVEMACRLWGLKATDIMQGVVYGTRIPEMLNDDGTLNEDLCTRFDYGECFGTAINRFTAQAIIGHPLTLYGIGKQKRGFLPLCDSMQCLTLAIENPPVEGRLGCRRGYRVFNQFEETYSLTELANKVVKVANKLDLGADIQVGNVENPRIEREDHNYNPDHQHLLDLGYKPTADMETEIETMFKDLIPHKERIISRKESIMPKIGFDGKIRHFHFMEKKQSLSSSISVSSSKIAKTNQKQDIKQA